MKIIADECLHIKTLDFLTKLGFEVLTIGTILQWGVEDEKIFHYGSKHNIPIITHDKRFGRLYFDSLKESCTTIVLAVITPHPDGTNTLIKQTLSGIDLDDEKYKNKLIIIESKKIRIRAKP